MSKLKEYLEATDNNDNSWNALLLQLAKFPKKSLRITALYAGFNMSSYFAFSNSSNLEYNSTNITIRISEGNIINFPRKDFKSWKVDEKDNNIIHIYSESNLCMNLTFNNQEK